MPPITRHQLKKSNIKTEPYSKENRPLEKRTVLLDLNNGIKAISNPTKQETLRKPNERIFKTDNIAKIEKPIKVSKPKNEVSKPIITKKPETCSSAKEVVRLSLNNSKEGTPYQTAIEELINTDNSTKSKELCTTVYSSSESCYSFESNNSELYLSAQNKLSVSCTKSDIFDIDKTNWNDFMYVGCYAREIFEYLRQREDKFIVIDYISNQSELTTRHRAIVVNWLVTLQEMYGLNHEVLYMAIKLIDMYLMKNDTPKNKFQLLASGALLLSHKIDEREPGFPFDLVKQSKYIFTEDELFETERDLAKSLNYDINVPLSYTFLRRYARCMRCEMILLTLARYILECSLLDYKFITSKDSLKAAAALFLAFKMCSKMVDAKEFQRYTGYGVSEIKYSVINFNNMLHTQKPDLSAVKQKYSHEIFYRVANKSLLSNSKVTFD